jgi:DNA-directed RNA polymerase alpha subunit
MNLDEPIRKLGLGARAHNCLDREGITTIGQLLKLDRRDVLDIRNLGAGSLDDIVTALGRHGFTLAGGAK